MHTFYASGFVFNPLTEEILLQQSTSKDQAPSPWTLFGNACSTEQKAENTFKKTVIKLLGITPKKVYPIYSYPNSEIKGTTFVFYTELNKSKKFADKGNISFAWFTIKQISRLKINSQTKQDITVGMRVIDSAVRKSMGEQYLE
jgi:hypothetical protein